MIIARNVTPCPPLPSGTTRMRSASATATSVTATAHQPAQSKPVSAPVASRPTMSPAASDAAPAPSCCTAPLKLMKLPRRRGATLPVTSAIAGPKRPGTKMKNSDARRDRARERQRRQVRHHDDAARARRTRGS